MRRPLGTSVRLPLYRMKGNLVGKYVFSSTSGLLIMVVKTIISLYSLGDNSQRFFHVSAGFTRRGTDYFFSSKLSFQGCFWSEKP